MGKFLMLDIGAGTLDLLWFDTDTGQQFKAVLRSPVQSLADQVAYRTGPLLITGGEMGGGPISQVLKEKATQDRVIMSRSAAATIHHSEDRVCAAGIQIVPDQTAEAMKETGEYSLFDISDIEIDRIEQVVDALGVPFSFDAVAVCAQDHGVPPAGVSHLDYRHRIFKEALDQAPYAHTLLYHADEVPKTFNRLCAIAARARQLPARAVYVMDSGMAAILGGSMDPRTLDKDRFMILDVATSHTLGAAVNQGEIAGFFEYHTRDIDANKLTELIHGLAQGTLNHARVLAEGGHGAYIRHPVGETALDVIITTGPKRRLMTASKIPLVFGGPLGDNMMTGTAGLLEALRRRKGLGEISYV